MDGNKIIKNYFLISIKDIISPRVLGCVVMVAFCICLDTWNQLPFLINGNISVYYYLFNSITFGGVYSPYLIPMLTVIPYGCSYYVEKEVGIREYIIGRTGKKCYVFNKMILGMLTGAFVPSGGVFLFTFVARMLVPIADKTAEVESMGFPYHQFLVDGSGVRYIFIIAGLQALRGIIFMAVTQWVSLYIDNLYSIIVTPLLFHFVVVQLGRLLRIPSELNLGFWFDARSIIISDTVTIVLCVMLAFLLIIASAYKCLKRIEES